MNHYIHLFIFGFLGLLVFLNSGVSAKCTPSANCDCNAANIEGCDTSIPNYKVTTRSCGNEFGCKLSSDIYQINDNGYFCYFSPCTKGSTIKLHKTFCNQKF